MIYLRSTRNDYKVELVTKKKITVIMLLVNRSYEKNGFFYYRLSRETIRHKLNFLNVESDSVFTKRDTYLSRGALYVKLLQQTSCIEIPSRVAMCFTGIG